MPKWNIAKCVSLYLITDDTSTNEQVIKRVQQALRGGITMVELRRKQSTAREIVDLAKHLRTLTRTYNVPLIINDRVDIALAVRADGVHVGEYDLPIAAARELLPSDSIVGSAAQSKERAAHLEQSGVDYIASGAVWDTSSKKNAQTIGLDMFGEITRSVRVPVVGVGGIRPYRVKDVLQAGAVGVAFVSAIMSADNPEQVARDFASAMSNKR